MPEPDFFTLKEILDDYFSRLQSSKIKDPQRNLLFLDLKQKLEVAIAGQNRVEAYEKYLPLSFSNYWKEMFFDKFLDEYVNQFESRLNASIDQEKLLEIEIKSLDIYDLSDSHLTGDIKVDGEKLGYALAINGDDPTLSRLIHHLTKYDFGIGIHVMERRDDFFNVEYWDLALKNYQEIFHKLHWVCVGYLNAKKVQYLKKIKFDYQNPVRSTGTQQADSSDKLSNKQQVLLVHKLGFLDLPIIQTLTVQNQGKLFAKLFGRNEKNTEDYIRYRNGKCDKKHSLNLPEVQKAVNDLLKELGLDNL